MKTGWILRCHGSAIMTVMPRRNLRRRRRQLHLAAGMRATDEKVHLLHSHRERGTRRPKQSGGWEVPSVGPGATRIGSDGIFNADGDPGVTAKVSCLSGGVCGAGNGNPIISSGRFPSQDFADRCMRCHTGFAPREHLAHATDEPTASEQSYPLEIIQGVDETP